jgi:hypothetical protein
MTETRGATMRVECARCHVKRPRLPKTWDVWRFEDDSEWYFCGPCSALHWQFIGEIEDD